MKFSLPIIIFLIVFGLGATIAVRYEAKKNSAKTEVLPTQKSAEDLPTSTATIAVGIPSGRKSSIENIILTVTSPVDNATVNSKTLVVKGKTKSKAEVFVNETETFADVNGNFSVNIQLDEGENYLLVLANDEDGNTLEQELMVTYDAGQ